jgi:polyhydroxyalkanoate synthase
VDVGGKRIVPRKITKPALVMIPSGDRIVPPSVGGGAGRSQARPEERHAARLPLGHIGMVVSGRARELCWTPLIDWLRAR